MKTHLILMKFKRRNVYLWIKVQKDLQHTLSEILTAFAFLVLVVLREGGREGFTSRTWSW